MTITVENRETGAECAVVICDDRSCHGRGGSKILHEKHKGYTDRFTPLTESERRKAMETAEEHDAQHRYQHAIRVIFFRVSNIPIEFDEIFNDPEL